MDPVHDLRKNGFSGGHAAMLARDWLGKMRKLFSNRSQRVFAGSSLIAGASKWRPIKQPDACDIARIERPYRKNSIESSAFGKGTNSTDSISL